MTDNAALDFNALSERIIAQTEAYEKFAQALAKILELLDEVKESLHDQDIENSDIMRDLAKAITVIGTQLEAYIAFTKDSDVQMVKNLAEYNNVNQQFIVELKNNREAIDELDTLFRDVSANINKRFEGYEAKFQESSELLEVLKETNLRMANQVASIYKAKQGWGVTLRSWKIYVVAFITILGLLGGAIQLGWLTLKWGNTHDEKPPVSSQR